MYLSFYYQDGGSKPDYYHNDLNGSNFSAALYEILYNDIQYIIFKTYFVKSTEAPLLRMHWQENK